MGEYLEMQPLARNHYFILAPGEMAHPDLRKYSKAGYVWPFLV